MVNARNLANINPPNHPDQIKDPDEATDEPNGIDYYIWHAVEFSRNDRASLSAFQPAARQLF